MSLRWQAALLDPSMAGGWAVVHCRQQFLLDGNGALFPRDWLKRLDLPLLSEQGLGHFDGEPVFLFELDFPADVPGARWQGLRQFMQRTIAICSGSSAMPRRSVPGSASIVSVAAVARPCRREPVSVPCTVQPVEFSTTRGFHRA